MLFFRGYYELVRDVTQGDYPDFDKYLPDLIVTLNPQAPQRAAGRAVEELLKNFKSVHGIPEQRRRDDKLEHYLKVWDLREGWTGQDYDCSQELRFEEISHRLEISLSTVVNRYRSAFKYLVGQEYSAGLWWKVVGALKLSGCIGKGLPRISRRRPSRTRRPREIPETALSNPNVERSEQRFLQYAGMHFDDLEQIDLLMDIPALIAQGRTDQQIIEELEIENENEAIEYLRMFRERKNEIQ